MTDEIEQIKQEFLAYRDQCIWLATVFNTHQSLFDGGTENDRLLREVAGWFFFDLSIVSQEYFVVLIGQLTDPATTKKSTNLSTTYFVKTLSRLRLLTPQITDTSIKIELYADNTVNARNKLVAHRDREAVLSRQKPKKWPMVDAINFVRNINSFCDLVAEQLGLEPVSFTATPAKGDAIDLIRFMKAGRNAIETAPK